MVPDPRVLQHMKLLAFPLNSQLALASGCSSGRVSMLGEGGTTLHLWLWHSLGEVSVAEGGMDSHP